MTNTPTNAQIDTEGEQPSDQQNRESAASGAGTDIDTDAGAGLDPGSETIRRYLTWGALGVCSLLAVFALIQFYGSVADTIDLWVDPKYQPLMRAAFNLAVLLGSLIGVSLLVRELS